MPILRKNSWLSSHHYEGYKAPSTLFSSIPHFDDESDIMSGNDTIIAHPPGDDCFRAVQHVGNPKGKFESIGGVETYVAVPEAGTSSKGVILYYSDVFGATYINNQLIMDYFASQGASWVVV